MNNASFAWKNLPAKVLEQEVEIRDEWNRLNALRGDLPFLDAEAVTNALVAFGQGKERLLLGRTGSRTTAMLVVSPAGKFRWQTFQPAQIPLGAWVAEPGVGLEALAASLNVGGFGLCVTFSLTQIDPRFAPREADSAKSRTADYIETGWIDISGSFEDFWNGRGRNLRQNMRKQRNKLE